MSTNEQNCKTCPVNPDCPILRRKESCESRAFDIRKSDLPSRLWWVSSNFVGYGRYIAVVRAKTKEHAYQLASSSDPSVFEPVGLAEASLPRWCQSGAEVVELSCFGESELLVMGGYEE